MKIWSLSETYLLYTPVSVIGPFELIRITKGGRYRLSDGKLYYPQLCYVSEAEAHEAAKKQMLRIKAQIEEELSTLDQQSKSGTNYQVEYCQDEAAELRQRAIEWDNKAAEAAARIPVWAAERRQDLEQLLDVIEDRLEPDLITVNEILADMDQRAQEVSP